MKKPKLIDTHAHLNFPEFKEDADKVIERCFNNGVWVINVGAEYRSSLKAVECAEKYKEGMYAVAGLHPMHIHTDDESKDYRDELMDLDWRSKNEEFNAGNYLELAGKEKVVAIGEIGLDYYAAKDNKDIKERQKEVFVAQLHLARMVNKPAVIHCRSDRGDEKETAHNDLIEIVSNFGSGCSACPMGQSCAPQLKGVIHCFSGTAEQAKKYLDLGFYLGFNGIITFTDKYDSIIKEMPEDRIILETDCPYLAPVPHRGKRNEPHYVEFVAKRIAEIRKEKFEKIAEITTKNARKLFNI